MVSRPKARPLWLRSFKLAGFALLAAGAACYVMLRWAQPDLGLASHRWFRGPAASELRWMGGISAVLGLILCWLPGFYEDSRRQAEFREFMRLVHGGVPSPRGWRGRLEVIRGIFFNWAFLCIVSLAGLMGAFLFW